MKTEYLIKGLLKSELSDTAKAKLGRLIKIMNSDIEKARYKPLIDALKTDNTIQLVFEYAEMHEQTNTQLSFVGYIDSTAVMLTFSISRRTLSNWCKKGIIRGKYFGGKYYFRFNDIDNLFLQNYNGNSADLSARKSIKK